MGQVSRELQVDGGERGVLVGVVPGVCVRTLQQERLERESARSHIVCRRQMLEPDCPASGSQCRAFWEVLRVQASSHSSALSLSGSRFVDTSALIRLPDDCTVGYIIECKLGGHLQSSPLFHSHLETLQLLGAAQLLTQVSWPLGIFGFGQAPTDGETEAPGGKGPP